MSQLNGTILGGDGRPINRFPIQRYDESGNKLQSYRDVKGPHGEPMFDGDGFVLPHYRTFASIWNAVNRTYRYTWDEALRRGLVDHLAMRRDIGIMEMVRERQLPTAQLNWHLEPEDPNDKFQKLIGDDLTKRLQRTPRLTQMRLCLLEASWYGRYGVQVVPEWIKQGPRRQLVISKWSPVNGDKIQYSFDGTPQIAVNMAWIPEDLKPHLILGDRFPMIRLETPALRQHFLIHKHEIDDADYFEGEMAGGVAGVGIRSRCYWFWWMRTEMLSWMTDYLERIGAGGLTIFGYDPGNPAAKTNAEQMAQQSNRVTALAWPFATPDGKSGIERIDPSEAGSNILRSIVDYYDEAIRRYIVGQNLSSNADQTGIGGDAAKQKDDIKFRNIRFDTENLDETLTMDLVWPLQHHGYNGEADYFRLKWVSELEKPNADKQLDAAAKVFEMGVSLDADEVRGLTGLSKPKAGAETLEKKEGEPTLPGMGHTFGRQQEKAQTAEEVGTGEEVGPTARPGPPEQPRAF